MRLYVYDSYAIIEYLKDNASFVRYFEEFQGMTTMFNLVEVYYCMLREEGKERADVAFDTFYPMLIQPPTKTLTRAMILKLKHKKKKLSYADCIGYQLALDRDLKFLTGDQQFKEMDNVEFVT